MNSLESMKGIGPKTISLLNRLNIYTIEDENNRAIYGAFQLYLDFINIFLDLLKLFGNSRD